MAFQSKKKKPVSKKNPVRKTVNKKRRRKKSKKSSNFKRNLFIVLALFMMISLLAFGYFLGQKSTSVVKPKVVQNEKHKKVVSVSKKIQEKKVATKKSMTKDVKPIRKKAKKTEFKESRISKREDVVLAYRSRKPKLVIIIDDVHTRAQLNAIKALDMKVTPSIFPPYKLAPQSHLLARGLDHYMIHLPMESSTRKFNRQYKTLKTSFSKEQIRSRIKELRALFPTAKYINNHTGSVFTANYKAMYTLYEILREEGFVFIDSRTSASTKVRKVSHAFGDAYVARDIFIDNIHTIPYIHQQLQKAVKMAKKKGYAIAIGHPHSVTMKALARAKDIFKDIELVYIDGIYKK
jgi:polysaccharide deacetylase 2 family uncharacterized protein YibQ